MLTAMLMHGVWDASGAIAGNSVLGWIVPLTVATVLISVFVRIYNTTQPIEREWMRELMAPEVALGVVSPDELTALAGTRSTLKSYVGSQAHPRTAKRVLAAESELAHQIARGGGAETPAVQRARAAVLRARGA
jgi:hypothetical protein